MDELGGFAVAEGAAPGLLEADDVGAVALGHLGHAVAEEAVGEDPDLHAGIDEVADGGFHAAATGGRDDERPLVLGAEDMTQHALVVLADLEEVGIEVADDRLRHRLVYPGMHLRRAGAKQ